MSVEHNTAEGISKNRDYWLFGAYGFGLLTFVFATYQFGLRPFLERDSTAEGVAFSTYWPIFLLYLAGVGVALIYAPKTLTKAQIEGTNTLGFSIGCVLAAGAGAAMSLAIGARGTGGTVIHFYWIGLAVLWSGSILMAHLSAKLRKPLAVRDWLVYAYAMLLLPLTFVPSIAIWPLFFDLDPHQSMMTAATSSFAGHFLAAHYVIFEILDRRRANKR